MRDLLLKRVILCGALLTALIGVYNADLSLVCIGVLVGWIVLTNPGDGTGA